MPTEQPLVSLCCSTYSRPDLFEESLRGLLRQTYAPLEIVVLVDGGNPESIKVLEANRDPRLRWVTTPKPSGMVPAWNKVVSASKGKYFLFCADDDVLLDSAVERQVEMLEANPGVGFAHGDFIFMDDDGAEMRRWVSHEGTFIKPGLAELERYLLQPKACMQTCVVRRSLWDQVGGWDEDAGYPGDNSLYLKLLRVSDVGHVAHLACRYRVRTRTPDSWLKDSNKVKEDVALARKHLADPPPALRERAPALRRAVENHFARNALNVLADARATPDERATFAAWAQQNLFQNGLHGAFYRFVQARGLEGLLAKASRLDHQARALARPVARSYHRSADNGRRVVRRARKAAQIGIVARNCVEVWRSVLGGGKLHELRLRDGLTIGAPDDVQLWNHFNDTWLDRTYTHDGFDIPTGGTVVDIGANIGLFSLLAARSAARVFSFEPFGPTFEWLSRNVETNGLGGVIRPFRSAVARDAGTRTFLVQAESTSNSFFQETGEPVTVSCTTLAAIVDEHCGGRCDFLKMDCEGAEFEILLEATDETLKRVRMLAMEVHEGVNGHTRVDLERRLGAAGFAVETDALRGPLIMRARNLSA